MKRNQLWPGLVGLVWTVLALSFFFAKFSQADSALPPLGFEKIEVPIGHVFIPPKGYDDNDNIQLILDGVLPNGCYRVANEDVQADPSTHLISAHLFALHRTDSVCAEGSHLPISLMAAVPYTLEVSLGTLPAGLWEIRYPRPGLVEGVQPFTISKALVTSVDDATYAAISSVWIPDTVRGDLPIHAELIGTLTSTCSFLQPEVSVQQIDDVFIVRQTVGFKAGMLCGMVMLPFQRTIHLGRVGEGRYLIHVRSMNGRSVNRVFSAVIPDP